MRGRITRVLWRPPAFTLALAAATAGPAFGQTVVNGSGLALRSSGTTSGNAATLTQNGFWGTYVTLSAPGTISLSATASGVAGSGGISPDMTISVADYSQSFAVSGAARAYSFTTPTLPAGTYFVRTQLDNAKTQLVNDVPATPTGLSLTLNNLTVGGGATVSNLATDANAIAAANTYINGFRKGDATVKLLGAPAGASVRLKLRSNAFRLGTYVSGGYGPTDNYLLANPPAGSDAANFQKFIDGRFNAIVPSNAGKWDPDATVSSSNVSTLKVGMSVNDQMMAYAAAHGMDARQHNLIWGSQQPTQIQTWLTTATSSTATSTDKAAAVANVKKAISDRIAYYISGTNSVNKTVRAANYQQLDVLNEALLTGNYYSVLGVSGVADVYKQAQDAVKAAGLNTRLYTNEYNVFQNAPSTVVPSTTYGGGATTTYGDPYGQYANFYRNEVEAINNAALNAGAKGNVVTGIGAQYYPGPSGGAKGPGVMQKALQNLSVAGLPISLTEFGGSDTLDRAEAPQLVDDTIRMMMGTPSADTMMVWGWYDTGTANPYGGGTALVNKGWTNADGSYNLTAAGRRFEYLFGRGLDPTAPGVNADGSNPNPLTTDLTLPVNADGTINFNGFYGLYDVIINGKTYALTLDKGADNARLVLAVPEPATLSVAAVLAVAGLRRRGRSSSPLPCNHGRGLGRGDQRPAPFVS